MNNSNFDPFAGQPAGFDNTQQTQSPPPQQQQYQQSQGQPQGRTNSDLGDEVMALWENTSKTSGNTYLAGKDKSGNNYIAFKNVKKKNPNEPDWRVYRKTS